MNIHTNTFSPSGGEREWKESMMMARLNVDDDDIQNNKIIRLFGLIIIVSFKSPFSITEMPTQAKIIYQY